MNMVEKVCICLTKKQKNLLKEIAQIKGFNKLTHFLKYLIVDYIMNNLDDVNKIKAEIFSLENSDFNLEEFLYNFYYDREILDDYKVEINVNELDYLVKEKKDSDKTLEKLKEMMKDANDINLLFEKDMLSEDEGDIDEE